MSEARTYRFSPPDRTGWLLGLGGPQVTVLGAAVVVSVLLASARAPISVFFVPLVAGAVLAFARIGGQPLLAAGPPAAAWALERLRGRQRWSAPLPPENDDVTALPPCLADQHFIEQNGAGVVIDRHTGRYAATIRVTGCGFGLAERNEQERLLAGWGDALAAFCRERGSVVAVRWTEWAAPAGIEEQLAFLAEQGGNDADDRAAASYRRLLDTAGMRGTRHEVLATVIVSAESASVSGRNKGARDVAIADVLLAETRLFSDRLEAAGLAVSTPLSLGELGRAVRGRLDPTCLVALDRKGRTLGQLAGVVDPRHCGPLATDARWSSWRVDDAWHRGYWVSDWPRSEVGPAWLGHLLLAPVGVRSMTVWCEPVAPRHSRRAIERTAAKLDADEDHRGRIGLRVDAAHRRAQTAVLEREAELVAGYPEFLYAGIITVTAPDRSGLDAASAQLVQTAAAAGLDLRPLHGRHDQAVAATLPLARGLT